MIRGGKISVGILPPQPDTMDGAITEMGFVMVWIMSTIRYVAHLHTAPVVHSASLGRRVHRRNRRVPLRDGKSAVLRACPPLGVRPGGRRIRRARIGASRPRRGRRAVRALLGPDVRFRPLRGGSSAVAAAWGRRSVTTPVFAVPRH